MSVELDEYKVRFGDLSYGPLMHWNVFYDLAIRGIEELSYRINNPIEELVATGRVPYAPVMVDMNIDRYPGYKSTILTTGRALAVGEKSFEIEYTFSESTGEKPLATAKVTHVTLDPSGEAENISDPLRKRLLQLQDGHTGQFRSPPSEISAEDGDKSFEKEVVFRTPRIEAVDLGYFTDYFRLIAMSLEEFLAQREISLRLESEEKYPFFATSGQSEFIKPIRFEDEITIRGTLTKVTPDTVVVYYEFLGADGEQVRIRGGLHFGCFDVTGNQVQFPTDIIDRLSDIPCER